MNIHEYQAKEIFRQYHVPVPQGVVILDSAKIKDSIQKLNTDVWVVKAQIHAGGRGKAGGVKIAKSATEAERLAKEMLGMKLVTHQTGPKGQKVGRVYIESGSDIKKEFYLSIIIDRDESVPVIIASVEGGMDIEKVAEDSPEKIIKVYVRTNDMWTFQARKVGFNLGFAGSQLKSFIDLVTKLYKIFIELDANQIEVNPLVLTKNDELIALDAKINFDENALFKHTDIQELRDESEEDPLEVQAKNHDLSYVKMDGNIGCMVNGAGLAMSTMDIIKYYGQEPANFLDVGGGATKDKVSEAFKIILSDSNVKAVLVNIFGGIMKCDIIAEGIVAAAKEVGIKIPLIIRLAGTNFELGKQILDSSGLAIMSADDLADAAQKVVNAVKE